MCKNLGDPLQILSQGYLQTSRMWRWEITSRAGTGMGPGPWGWDLVRGGDGGGQIPIDGKGASRGIQIPLVCLGCGQRTGTTSWILWITLRTGRRGMQIIEDDPLWCWGQSDLGRWPQWSQSSFWSGEWCSLTWELEMEDEKVVFIISGAELVEMISVVSSSRDWPWPQP